MTIDPKLYGAGTKWTVTFEPEQAPVPRGSENGNRYSPTGREMLTHSGRMADLSALRAQDICLEDIAYHLAGQERFGGAHPRRPNVAQHSLAVEHIACELWARNGPMDGSAPVDFGELRRAALMHDAAEAYVGDCTGAVKKLMRDELSDPYGGDSSAFDLLEGHAERVIFDKYSIDISRAVEEIVHEADCIACAYEMQLDGWCATDCPAWALADKRLAALYRLPQGLAARVFGERAAALGLLD